MSNIKKNIIVV